MRHKEPLWTRDFILLFTYNFFIMIAFFLLMVSISGYAVDTFGVSTSSAGLVAGVFIIGSLVGRIVTGHQVNVRGAKKIMYIGAAMFVVTYGLYFVANSLTVLIVIRFLNGVANGVATTAVSTIAAVALPMSRRSEGISYFSLNFVLATALGPFLTFYLLTFIDYQTLFVLVFVIVILSSTAVLFVQTDTEPLVEKGEKLKFTMVDKNALPVALVILIVCMTYSTVLSFINLFAVERNLVIASSWYFLVYAVVVLLSRPITGRMMDMRGTNIVMLPAIVMALLGYIVFANAYSAWMLLGAAVLLGLGYGNIQSIIQALCIKVAEPKNVGMATSTYFICLDFGLGVGSYVFGFLIPYVGFTGLYYAMALMIVLAFVVYMFVYGRKEKMLSQY